MPKPPIEQIAQVLDHAETFVALLRRLDRLADRLVTVGELRFRAEVARRKERNSKSATAKRLWAWRARRLDARADRLERQGR